MLGAKTVRNVLRVYGKAWTTQDSEKILTIFTNDAVYRERAFQKPFIGHRQIRKYWQSKVVGEQSDIKFKLLNVYTVGNTAVAEWKASFYNKKKKKRIRIIEIAVLKFRGSKIASLREYWHAETVPKSRRSR